MERRLSFIYTGPESHKICPVWSPPAIGNLRLSTRSRTSPETVVSLVNVLSLVFTFPPAFFRRRFAADKILRGGGLCRQEGRVKVTYPREKLTTTSLTRKRQPTEIHLKRFRDDLLRSVHRSLRLSMGQGDTAPTSLRNSFHKQVSTTKL